MAKWKLNSWKDKPVKHIPEYENKDQLRKSLKLLYSVDNLRPFIIEALTIIDRIETEKKNQKIKNNLIRLIKW